MDWRPASLTQECALFCASLAKPRVLAASRNIGFRIDLAGEIDGSIVERSVDALSRRCDMLRASLHRIPDRTEGEGNIRLKIYEHGGALIPGLFAQRIKEHAAIRMSAHQLLGGEKDQTRSLRDFVRQELGTPFDFEKSPLFRATLIRVTRDRAVLLLVVVPFICDELSLQIVARQLKRRYLSNIEAKSPYVNPVHGADNPDSFNWRPGSPNSSEFTSGLAFWKKYWADFGPALLTPRDLHVASRSAGRTGKVSGVQRIVEPALTLGAVQFIKEQGITLFVLTFAALSVVLSHHCRRDRVAVRRRFTNRGAQEFYSAIGALETTGIIGVQIPSNARGRDVLERAREAVRVTSNWRQVPTPVIGYQVAIAMQECVSLDFRIRRRWNNSAAETYISPTGTLLTESRPCLRYFVTQSECTVCLSTTYSTDLFSDGLICGLLSEMEMMIRFLIEHADRKIEEATRLLRSPLCFPEIGPFA